MEDREDETDNEGDGADCRELGEQGKGTFLGERLSGCVVGGVDGLVVFVRCGEACGLCLVRRSLSRDRKAVD